MQDGMGTLRKVAGKFLIAGLALVEVLAMAGCSGGSSSTSGNQTATPAFSPGGGTYTVSKPVTISDATPGAVLYCTTDGTTPTTSSPQCSQPTTVFQSEFLQAIAVAPNMAPSAVASAGYTISLNPAATPTFSPGGGTFTSAQTVTINDLTAGATIYYTTDGTAPAAPSSTTTSKLYTAPVTVSTSETLNAIAVASGYSDSQVASTKHIISQPVAAPTFSVPTGTYTSAQTVTISDAAAGAAIYYTLDGTAPTANSTRYSGPIKVAKTEVVSAIAVLAGNSSAVTTAAYAIVQSIPAPTFNPASGATVTAGQTVTITDGDANASIYYTTNGTTPTATNSTPYNGPFALNTAGTVTIEAIAIDTGNNSPVTTATYTVGAAAPPTPTFSPASGATVSVGQSVTIADGDASASIYYTLDGTTPTVSSTSYSKPVVLNTAGAVTIEAIAIDAGKSSSVATATYTVTTNGLPLAGVVSSGTKLINGAKVQLYAAGVSGYGSPGSTVGAVVTTDSSGAFKLNYNCPVAPGDQMYVVATGGDIGNGANTGIVLMTALGTCSSLSSSLSSITVNEVTTIASAYALSAFAAIDKLNGGIDIGAPGSATTCTAANNWASSGADTCNYTGLVNAFAAVTNLVNLASGDALTSTPAYKLDLAHDLNVVNNSQVPTTRINALADMLASCVQSSSAGCSGNSGLFTAAATKGSNPITPADTLQAALNIAQNPGNDVSGLLGLVTTPQPYTIASADTGTLVLSGSGAPVDLTLALTFTGGGLGIYPASTKLLDNNLGIINSSLAIDGAGNIWVAGFLSGSIYFGAPSGEMIAEFNALGAPLTSATSLSSATPAAPKYGGFIPQANNYGLTALAIDQSQTENLWMYGAPNGASGNVLKIGTGTTPPSLLKTISGGFSNTVAIDAFGDAWLSANGQASNVTEFQSDGTAGVQGKFITGFSSFPYLVFDSNGGLWTTAITSSNQNTDVLQLSATDGSLFSDEFQSSSTSFPTTLVADGSGYVYGCDPTGLNLEQFSAGTAPNPIAAITTGRACGTQLVLDGQGHIFAVLDTGFTFPLQANLGIDEYTTGGAQISPVLYGYTGSSSMEAPTLDPDVNYYAGGLTGIGAAMDRSGNLWVLNADTDGTNFSNNSTLQPGNVLVEYIGIGAPVITPASAGLANHGVLQGVRP